MPPKIITSLGSIGILAWFLIVFVNLALFAGIAQIISIGIPYEIHCSVESTQVNITKWTTGNHLRTSVYSINATFRVDNQLHTLTDELLSETSLFELLEGTGDTNKKREVQVKISHRLFPEESFYSKANENYSVEHLYTGNAYQNCFMNSDVFYYSNPPSQDFSVILIVFILFCTDLVMILSLFLIIKNPS